MPLHNEFVSPLPASPDPNKVDGPKWNAPLKLTGGTDGDTVIRDTTDLVTGMTFAPMLPGVPVTSNAQIPVGQARLIIEGTSPNLVYSLRYNDGGGVFFNFISFTEPQSLP